MQFDDTNSNSSGDGGQRPIETHDVGASLEETIKAIRYWHRRRVFMMDQRKRSDLALGAFLRGALGWSRNIPAAEARAIADRAQELIAIGERVAKEAVKPEGKAKIVAGQHAPDFMEWADVIMASLAARAPVAAIENHAEKEMDRLARTLPVWPWFSENVFSGSAISLAVIVAEAGDIGAYANPGKLWKRMGLAPITKDGVTRAGATWRKGGLSKEDWTEAGYSMRRRSFMFVIGDSLIKGKSYLREVFVARREYERVTAAAKGLIVAPSAKIPAKRKDEFMSDGHVLRRSQRYMEKRLLRDLWVAWREAAQVTKSDEAVPSANHSPDAGDEPARAASQGAKPRVHAPPASHSAGDPAGTEGHCPRETHRSSALGPSLSADDPGSESGAGAERPARNYAKPTTRSPGAPIPATAGERRARLVAKPGSLSPAAHSSGDEPERPTSSRLKPTPGASVATLPAAEHITRPPPISEKALSVLGAVNLSGA